MKWKLTNRFLMTIMTIIFIVIIVNLVLLVGLLYWQSNKSTTNDSVNDEVFTRDFKQYISTEQNVPNVNDAGLSLLTAHNAWIQILDSNGTVVTSYFAPSEAPSHYRPIDIVQHYKYQEYDTGTTVYVSNKDDFSYLIGIFNPDVSRYTLSLNGSSIINVTSKYVLYIIIVDLIIALFAGLMFGSILTKPLYVMIDSIQQLKNRNFHLQKVKRPGIYKQVFTNLQDVSSELEKQENEHKKLEQMRNEWISNISHDMKTPLASIQGYAELLNDADVSDVERKEYAEVIERKSVYMRELIDDFNLTMKLRQHKLPLQLTEVRIEKLLRDLVINVLNDPQFTMSHVHFESTASELVLTVDEHLMQRAITNFLMNALIHNPGDTQVTVALTEVDRRVMIEIRDNGRGMSQEDVENVFERYYRGSNTTNVRGTGLGTAIARDIIIAHGGEVSIESEIGNGTTVKIRI
ncbi:HAMP domain-containing histidine kinase [Solibacillus sp. MA9]|uniref:histidine kinase n=1 Tax=Solibacillus palustris TaxID=2908203 RepID=A0ABS9UIQ2_9BACL|nr:HAMP domain-containing sensor histidine kinase [Solibacillus sp. MA9]MCH7323815.1 HAMP domain-containing histidine kinase [Solibacillus sp. MA9]